MIGLVLKAISIPVRHRLSIVLINQVINLISFAYIIYYLGIETFGEFSKGLVLIQISIIVLEWGFQNHSAEILNKDTNPDQQSQYFWNTCLIKLILFSSITLSLYAITKLIYNEFDSKIYLGLILVIFFGGMNPIWFLNIIGQSKKLIFPTFIGKFIYLFLILFFVKEDSHYLNLFYFFGISYLIPSLWGLKYLYESHLELPSFSIKKLMKNFKDSSYFFLSSLILQHISSFWSLFVTLNFSKSLIGTFVFIEQLYRGLIMISNLIGNSTRIETYSESLIITKTKIKNIIIFLTVVLFTVFLFLYFFQLLELNSFNLNFIFLIALSWFAFSISRLISYPVVAKLFNSNYVNNIILIYGLLNFVLIFYCQIYLTPSLLSVTFFMLTASCLELIMYLYFIFTKLSKLR